MVVTNFIRKYAEKCISTKTILVFPNQKPWVNQKVQHLLRTRFQTFRSGNTGSNRRSRYDLNKVIRKAKKHFHSKLEDEKDVQQLWQRFHTKFQVQVHITSKSQLVHQCGITPGPARSVIGALHSLNCSIYHLHTQRDGENKTVSKLLLGTRPPTTLGTISTELQKVLINIDEICHLETKDINECEHEELNSCSLRATCSNTDGSHMCKCQNGFTDKDPSRRGRDCREVATAIETMSSAPVPSVMDPERSPPNTPSTESPLCSPLPVTNVMIVNVTSISFQVSWTRDMSKDQTVTVQVLKGDIMVNEMKTQEMNWTVMGLEPAVLYTVEVHWQSCGNYFTKELKVKTAALLLNGRVRIQNYNFTETLGNTSSGQFRQFLQLWHQEIERSLPPTIHRWHQNGKILVRIKSLSAGSILVDLELVFHPEIEFDIWNASSALISSLYNSSVFEFHHNSTSISDVNECTSPIYHDCSPHAMCKNTEGSYTCTCSESYRDVNPAWPGRLCEAPSPVTNVTVSEVTGTSFLVTWTTEVDYKEAFILQVLKNDSVVNETETTETEWNVSGLQPGTEYTLTIVCRICGEDGAAQKMSVKTDPTPVINLTVSNVTTAGFHLTWTTDTFEDQMFNVQVLKTDSIVKEVETMELEWTVLGLEPETEYTVSVVSRACEEESAATEMSVKTATPSPIINLTVFNITTKSFHITWTTDNYEEQTFNVQLLKDGSVVKETETLELALTVSGLESGTEYTVSVASRSCEQEGVATELNIKTAETTNIRAKRSAMDFVSTLTVYLNRPGFTTDFPFADVPLCSPSSVTNLAVSRITSEGFQLTWTIDTNEEQTYVVQVWKDNIVVSETATQEMEWIVSGLEPGTAYTVTMVSRACQQESTAVDLNVRTALSPIMSATGISISDALDLFSPNSAQAFTSSSVEISMACVPPLIRSLTAFNVTSNSLKVIWETDDAINQEFLVQLWKDDRIVADAKTKEQNWTMSNLEAGVLYTVRVVSWLCGTEGKAKLQEIKTAARIMEGRARITNLMFNEGLRDRSSDQFKNFTDQFIAQVFKHLPKYTANLLASGKFKILVKSLREGSVKVDFQVIFNEELAANVSKIIRDIVTSLGDGSVFTFDPDSTGISDYNECASLEDNDCSFNAKCINTEGSYTCTCSDSFVDANPVQPGRNCREPTVASLITTAAVSESILVNCKLHEISVIMERSFLEARHIPASSLYLGSSHCNGSFGNSTHVALKVGWTECGTQISNNDTHTVVKTTLRSVASSSAVSADGNLEVPVNCTFDNSLLLPDGYTPNGRNRMSLEGIGNYMASIETFNGNQTLLEDPLLDPEDEVSIQVSIDTLDHRVKLILMECWATPSNNTTRDSLYTIIKTGCPVPGSSIKMSENGNSTSANFTLKVFSFISMPFVYIHCQTRVCLEVNGSSCQPSCSGSHLTKTAEVIAERTVSLGPLYRKYSNEVELVVEMDENISALKAVLGLGVLLCLTLVVISAVMMTVYTRWGRSFTAQPTGPNYQAFDNY
ncbi:uromodulin-like 1 [Amblyraja radiata]|uniref:uromodulin-like 1 n=1 Tax=Amblyraja radiata TaxID=386614 RepID=UPI0014036B04|nr:uromodulin-like 1 [Amblyraja radiata]